MRSKEILNALGKVDDKYIEEVSPHKKATKHIRVKWGLAVACLCLFVCVAVFTIPYFIENSDGTPEIAISSKNIEVFYISETGEMVSKSIYVRCTAKDILDEWMILNNVTDVTLIKCEIEDNGEIIYHGDENDPNATVQKKMGDYFIWHLTLSSEFTSYANSSNGQLLIESLKQTFYHYFAFDEFDLIINK